MQLSCVPCYLTQICQESDNHIKYHEFPDQVGDNAIGTSILISLYSPIYSLYLLIHCIQFGKAHRRQLLSSMGLAELNTVNKQVRLSNRDVIEAAMWCVNQWIMSAHIEYKPGC